MAGGRPWSGRLCGYLGAGAVPLPTMLFLVVTVVADVAGVVLLGSAHGLERPLALVAGVLALLLGFVMFSYAC